MTPNVGEDVDKLDPSYANGGNVKWYSPVENSLTVLSKLKMDLPYILAIAFLGICLRQVKIYFHSGTCIQMFREVLFIIISQELETTQVAFNG